MSDTEVELVDSEIGQAFVAGIDNDLDEDQIKMSMIQAGSSFKTVTRQYNELMVLTGNALSKDEKDEIVKAAVLDNDISEEDGFDDAVKQAVDASDLLSEAQAGASIRAYAKKNDMECYKKPKSEGATRNPFVKNFHEALIDNPNMTEDDLNAIIDALPEENQSNPRRWFSQHNNIRKVVNAIAKRYED